MLVGCLLAGCATHSKPIAPPDKQTPAEVNFEATWSSAIDVLRSFDFTLDRQDRRAGVVTTAPMVGRHWFEFWRRDGKTAFYVLENSLHTTYRTATVQISPDPASPDNFVYSVEVMIYRSNKPGRQAETLSTAFNMYNTSKSSDVGTARQIAGFERDIKATASTSAGTLTFLGPDEHLAGELNRRIRKTINRRIASSRQ